MNRILVVENIGEDTFRLENCNGYEFINNLEKFCYSHFTHHNGNSGVFAFILNDNENNYFAELLSNDQFLQELDHLIHEKMTLFWCEPKIANSQFTINQFEHFVKVDGLDPTILWPKLVKKLQLSPLFHRHNTSLKFPSLFLISFEKKLSKGVISYPMTEIYYSSLNAYGFFDNVEIFREEFVHLFRDIINVIDSNISKGKKAKDFFHSLEKISNEIVKNRFKVVPKSGYKDLDSFVKDLFENIGT